VNISITKKVIAFFVQKIGFFGGVKGNKIYQAFPGSFWKY